MIAVTEIEVAVVASVLVGAAAMLLVYLLTRLVRWARAAFAGELLDRGVEHGTAIGRELVGRQPGDHDNPSSLDRVGGLLVGGCLIASAALSLVGTFVPLYRAVRNATPSFTLYDTLHYTAIVWYLEIALLVAIGWLAIRRRDRVVAAVVVGYCAPAIGAVALYAAFLTFPRSHLGPAYYLFEIGDGLQAVALVIAGVTIAARSADRAHPRVQSARLGVLAALLLAVSATMNLTRLPRMPLWSFGLLPSREVPAIVVNLVVLAVVPLLAIRLGENTGSFVVLGLAVATALSVADAALSRIGTRGLFELTVGFWLTALASAALFVLVGSLRHHDSTLPVTQVPATIG